MKLKEKLQTILRVRRREQDLRISNRKQLRKWLVENGFSEGVYSLCLHSSSRPFDLSSQTTVRVDICAIRGLFITNTRYNFDMVDGFSLEEWKRAFGKWVDEQYSYLDEDEK